MTQPAAKPNATIVVCMTVLAVAVIAAATVMVMAGKDIGPMLGVMGVAVVPVLTYFGARFQATQEQTNTLANGNLAALRDALVHIAKANAATVATVAAPTQQPPEGE